MAPPSSTDLHLGFFLGKKLEHHHSHRGFLLHPPSPFSLSLSPTFRHTCQSICFAFQFFLFSLLLCSIRQWFIIQIIFSLQIRDYNLLKVLHVVGCTSSCILKQSQTPQPTLQFRLQFATSPTCGTPGVIFLTFVISH